MLDGLLNSNFTSSCGCLALNGFPNLSVSSSTKGGWSATTPDIGRIQRATKNFLHSSTLHLQLQSGKRVTNPHTDTGPQDLPSLGPDTWFAR